MQQFSPTGKPLFHIVLSEFQFFGNGFDGLMFAIKQYNRFAVNFWNALKRTPQDGSFLFGDGLFSWKQFARRQLRNL